MTTRTGTLVAVRDGDTITLALTVTAPEFIDIAAGLSYLDILGGWGAWHTVPPVGEQAPRIAGQFTLRRTYSDEAIDTQPAAGTQAASREDTAGAPVPGEQAGRSDSGEERGAGATTGGEDQTGAGAAVPVPESASVADPYVQCANGPCVVLRGTPCQCTAGSYRIADNKGAGYLACDVAGCTCGR